MYIYEKLNPQTLEPDTSGAMYRIHTTRGGSVVREIWYEYRIDLRVDEGQLIATIHDHGGALQTSDNTTELTFDFEDKQTIVTVENGVASVPYDSEYVTVSADGVRGASIGEPTET